MDALSNEKQDAIGIATTCEACQKKEAIYRCPGCGMRTCCLPCIKSHRDSTGCTGKRSRTAFCKVSDFSEKKLLMDIRLMEEIEREFDSARRRQPPKCPDRLPKILQELHREAGKRKIRLEFLGPGLQKRCQNSTYFERKTRRMLWHVEWDFTAAKLHIHDRRVPEETCLRDALEKHVKPQRRGFKDDEKMAPYSKAGPDSLAVLLKQARAPAADVRHYKLELQQSLSSQLEGKVIIEYPVFLVVLLKDLTQYQLFEPQKTALASEENSESGMSSSEEDETA